jgi:hypothetical protein
LESPDFRHLAAARQKREVTGCDTSAAGRLAGPAFSTGPTLVPAGRLSCCFCAYRCSLDRAHYRFEADMQFIDLGAQRERIRDRLKAAIDNVVEEGRYILGPQVTVF